MSHFSTNEISYMQSQQLGRLATVNAAGDPHVVPVGFRYNSALDTIDIGGHNFGKSKKFQEARDHGKVAFVIDDVLPPWQPRGIEVRGRVEAIEAGGSEIVDGFDSTFIRVHPTRIVSWGIDSDAYKPNSRKVG